MTKDELADKHMCRATGYSLACEILDGSYGDADTLSVKILEWVKEDFLFGYEAAESEIRELREKLECAESAFLKLYNTVDYWATAGLIENYSETAKSISASLGDVMDEACEALSKIRGGNNG